MDNNNKIMNQKKKNIYKHQEITNKVSKINTKDNLAKGKEAFNKEINIIKNKMNKDQIKYLTNVNTNNVKNNPLKNL